MIPTSHGCMWLVVCGGRNFLVTLKRDKKYVLPCTEKLSRMRSILLLGTFWIWELNLSSQSKKETWVIHAMLLAWIWGHLLEPLMQQSVPKSFTVLSPTTVFRTTVQKRVKAYWKKWLKIRFWFWMYENIRNSKKFLEYSPEKRVIFMSAHLYESIQDITISEHYKSGDQLYIFFF